MGTRQSILRTNIYVRYPEVVKRVQNSSEALALAWDSARVAKTSTQSFLRNVLIKAGLGIDDIADHEVAKVNAWEPTENITTIHLANIFAEMVSRRAEIGVSILSFVCSL